MTDPTPLSQESSLGSSIALRQDDGRASLSDLPDENLVSRFERIVAQYPNKVAVKSRNDQLTFVELNRAANRLARAILERRGSQPEPIALLMDKNVSMIAGIWAVLKSGKFYVALEPNSPLGRLQPIFQDSQALLILTDTPNLPLAEKLISDPRAILNLDDGFSYSDENLNFPISRDDLMSITYTSGSTGTPKGLTDVHSRWLRLMLAQRSQMGVREEDRMSLLGSVAFSASRSHVFGSLLNGAGLYLYDLRRDGLSALGDWLMQEEITILNCVPSLFRHFATLLQTRRDLQFPKLRLIRLGGEAILRRDIELYKKYFPDACTVRVSLSATEVGTITTFFINKQTEITGNIVPVGYPTEGNRIEIVDDASNPVPGGEVGEIVFKSHQLLKTFWRKPELTDQVFPRAPDASGMRMYHTGDLGRLRADGMLEHVGRKDEQVKIRGHRVEMAEVEMALLDIPGIKDACVAGREGRDDEKQLVGYVIADPKSTPAASEIRSALEKRLPDYMIPSAVVYLDALPLLPNGKIDRRALPAPERGARKTTDAYRAPRDRYELEMVRLWEELLGIEPVGTQDNFFDLGGHSLLAARLLVEIEKKYGQKFPPRILLQASTVEQLAQLLYDEGWKPAWSPAVPIHANGTQPPLFYIPPFNAVFGFYQLDAFMERDQPVYGLLASPGGDEFPFTRVEDEAAYYLSQIKTIQPHGPYYLAGWSSGGLVALDVAQRLVRAGQTVAFLGLFDTVIRSRDLRSQVEYSACRLKYLWRLGPRQLLSRVIARVQKHAGGHFDPAREERRAEILGEFRQRPDYAAIADRVGYRGYVHQNYPGRVDLFLTTTPRLNPCVDPVKHWSRLAAGVQVHAIPGMHNAIFEEPHARPVIEKLQAALRQAQIASRDEMPIEKSS